MLQVIGDTLFTGIGVSFSPLALIMLMVLLTTKNGRTTSVLYTLGWYLGCFFGIALAAYLGSAGGAGESGSAASKGVDYFGLFIAALFFYLAYKQYQSRPEPGKEAEMPGWLEAVNKFGPLKDFLAGFLLILLNAKNIPLLSGMGLTLSQSNLGTGTQLLTAAIMAISCSLVPIGIVLLNLIAGEKAEPVIQKGRHWLVQNNATIMMLLFALLGFSKLGEALSNIA